MGYTGGSAPDPTYRSVCGGDGHTEAIKIDFDPSRITYEELLDVFFKEHMPTRRAKAQYKSAVWTHSDAQAEAFKSKLAEAEGELGVKLVTDVAEAGEWYDAEEYHQKYLDKMGKGGRFGWF